MSQRMIALLTAVPLLALLAGLAVLVPLPFATYKPCDSFDVLAETSTGAETIKIDGAKTYRDDGELRLTTVCVSLAETELSGLELLTAWADRDAAVIPFEVAHPNNETNEEARREGQAQMVASQDTSIAAALTLLDYDVEPRLQVLSVTPGSPAEGKLEVRDRFVSVDGTPIETPDDLTGAIAATGADRAVEIVVERVPAGDDEAEGEAPEESGEESADTARERVTVKVKPELVDGNPAIGIALGGAYDFPLDVSINIDPAIGGPSAGLMFALGIYDTLTPGSLTGGTAVAGTGTIDAERRVGPIGGIQQKIAGAREVGSELFLVPPGNCDAALGAQNGDMRLAAAATLDDAIAAVEAFANDPTAELPTCEDALDQVEQVASE